MSNLKRLQIEITHRRWDGFVVPSTDEYLSEFVPASAQRLRWATGFEGSTGLGIVLPERAALFVDGRYSAQAARDTAGLGIEILGATESIRNQWLDEHLTGGQQLALDTRLQPYPEVERLMAYLAGRQIRTIEVDDNPIDALWGHDRPAASDSPVRDYPLRYAGASSAEKCTGLRAHMAREHLDVLLLTDPEDVSWLLNIRTQEPDMGVTSGWHTVPVPLSRLLMTRDGPLRWFVDSARIAVELMARLSGTVEICDPVGFEDSLRTCVSGRTIGANLRKLPHRFADIAARGRRLKSDIEVTRRRWIKHPNEIVSARAGYIQDGIAVIRFLAWLTDAVKITRVSELDAARQLTVYRQQLPGYLGPSEPLMSASGANGAVAHYIPSESSDRALNDHPLYWMDSGAQFLGCTTDNTVCFAVGVPEPQHVRAHTLVIKGLIALTRLTFPVGISSTQVDSFARQYLWQVGVDYAHGTGHGVGNFMNIHEGPYVRKDIDHPLVAPLEAGMILANEPAYYKPGDFGVRVETHMLIVPSRHEGFLEFETLSCLPMDPRLIDPSLLTAEEKHWLADYHERIVQICANRLDSSASRWLSSIVEQFRTIAGSNPLPLAADPTQSSGEIRQQRH